MKWFACLLSLLLVISLAYAAPLKEPVQITGEASTFISVGCDCKDPCAQVRWTVIDEGLSLFDPEQLKNPCKAIVLAARPGTYRIMSAMICGKDLTQTLYEVVVVQPVEKKKDKAYGPTTVVPVVAEAIIQAPVYYQQPAVYYQQAPMAMPMSFGGGGCSTCR